MDSKVLGVLEEIVGNEVFSEFKERYVEGYMDLLREIEVFKRNIKPESDGKINMAIPYVSLDEICFKMRNQHLRTSLRNLQYATISLSQGTNFVSVLTLQGSFLRPLLIRLSST